MKKILIATFALASICVAATAQDSYYAEMLSRNNYYGTARSVALGNAMTALGGDLGSIGINPAGSAVANYSQFTITPGLLFSSTGASYSPDGSQNFGSPYKTSHTKFNLPNIGLMFTMFSNDEYSSMRSMSMGFVANTTNTFLNYTTARGVNSATSFLGGLAAGAYGLSPDQMPRDLYAAYCANQIGEYGPVGSNVYAGANQRINDAETYAYVPGDLDQASVYNTYGSKSDIAFNIGFNMSNRFYFGFNLGIPTLQYSRQEVFSEVAREPGLFPVIFYTSDSGSSKVSTNYSSSTNSYALNSKATGIYGKFGFIVLPTDHLRIGAAIQTPTMYSVTERWQYQAATSYENSDFDGNWKSTIGEASYSLRAPYIVDAGIAYTLPGIGLFSVDYELTDYSVMQYRDESDDYYFNTVDNWAATNAVNNAFCGVSHSVRAGIEVKPLPELSIRAGYSFVTDPEKYYDNLSGGDIVTAETVQFLGNSTAFKQQLGDSHYFRNTTHAVSLGAGYSSPGSFFADVALRLTSYPVSYYAPYYYGSYEAVDKNNKVINYGSPLERLERNVFDVLLTLGWRF